MSNPKKMLLAVDGSTASRRAVDYVADMVAGNADIHVGLFHLISPPRMLEWGGSENPEIEETVGQDREQAYREMEAQVQQKGNELLQDFQEVLTQEGIEATVLPVEFEARMDRKHIVDDILRKVEQGSYGTIVVGKHSFSWLENLFSHHVGESLVRKGNGIAVWVIE